MDTPRSTHPMTTQTPAMCCRRRVVSAPGVPMTGAVAANIKPRTVRSAPARRAGVHREDGGDPMPSFWNAPIGVRR